MVVTVSVGLARRSATASAYPRPPPHPAPTTRPPLRVRPTSHHSACRAWRPAWGSVRHTSHRGAYPPFGAGRAPGRLPRLGARLGGAGARPRAGVRTALSRARARTAFAAGPAPRLGAGLGGMGIRPRAGARTPPSGGGPAPGYVPPSAAPGHVRPRRRARARTPAALGGGAGRGRRTAPRRGTYRPRPRQGTYSPQPHRGTYALGAGPASGRLPRLGAGLGRRRGTYRIAHRACAGARACRTRAGRQPSRRGRHQPPRRGPRPTAHHGGPAFHQPPTRTPAAGLGPDAGRPHTNPGGPRRVRQCPRVHALGGGPHRSTRPVRCGAGLPKAPCRPGDLRQAAQRPPANAARRAARRPGAARGRGRPLSPPPPAPAAPPLSRGWRGCGRRRWI